MKNVYFFICFYMSVFHTCIGFCGLWEPEVNVDVTREKAGLKFVPSAKHVNTFGVIEIDKWACSDDLLLSTISTSNWNRVRYVSKEVLKVGLSNNRTSRIDVLPPFIYGQQFSTSVWATVHQEYPKNNLPELLHNGNLIHITAFYGYDTFLAANRESKDIFYWLDYNGHPYRFTWNAKVDDLVIVNLESQIVKKIGRKFREISVVSINENVSQLILYDNDNQYTSSFEDLTKFVNSKHLSWDYYLDRWWYPHVFLPGGTYVTYLYSDFGSPHYWLYDLNTKKSHIVKERFTSKVSHFRYIDWLSESEVLYLLEKDMTLNRDKQLLTVTDVHTKQSRTLASLSSVPRSRSLADFIKLSHDRKTIVYAEQDVPEDRNEESRHYTINLIDVESGEIRRLHESREGTVGGVAWSADDRSVFYMRYDNAAKNMYTLFAIDLETGERESVLTDTMKDDYMVTGFAVTPDYLVTISEGMYIANAGKKVIVYDLPAYSERFETEIGVAEPGTWYLFDNGTKLMFDAYERTW